MSLGGKTRRRLRNLRDPRRRDAVLASLAATETQGAANLSIVARRQRDAWLRADLANQAADIARHAERLRRLVDTTDAIAQPFDLTGGRDQQHVDRHGFPTPHGHEALGLVGILATLHVAAVHSRAVYQICGDPTCGDANRDDHQVFRLIEKNYGQFASRTGGHLDRLRAAGRGREVAAALKAARRSGFLAAWRELGLRSGAGFSRGMLYLLYWSLLLPFGLLARRSKRRPAVRTGAGKPLPRPGLRTQY